MTERDLEPIRILLGRGRFVDGEVRVRRVLAQRPDDEWALRLLAWSLVGQKRHDEALEATEAACRAAPDQALCWVQLANAHIKRGAPAEAITAAERAVRCAPQAAVAHEAVARAFLTETTRYRPSTAYDPGRGLASADEAIRLSPTDPNLWSVRSWALLLLGRRSEARTSYRKTLELDPNHVAAVNGLAWLEVKQRPIYAVRGFARALTLAPHVEVYRINIASAIDMWIYRMIWIWLWAGIALALTRPLVPLLARAAVVSVTIAVCLAGTALLLRRVPSGSLTHIWSHRLSSSIPLFVRLAASILAATAAALADAPTWWVAATALVALAIVEWKVNFTPLSRWMVDRRQGRRRP